jgi:Leucine-rich repeat (LRR) protein
MPVKGHEKEHPIVKPYSPFGSRSRSVTSFITRRDNFRHWEVNGSIPTATTVHDHNWTRLLENDRAEKSNLSMATRNFRLDDRGSSWRTFYLRAYPMRDVFVDEHVKTNGMFIEKSYRAGLPGERFRHLAVINHSHQRMSEEKAFFDIMGKHFGHEKSVHDEKTAGLIKKYGGARQMIVATPMDACEKIRAKEMMLKLRHMDNVPACLGHFPFLKSLTIAISNNHHSLPRMLDNLQYLRNIKNLKIITRVANNRLESIPGDVMYLDNLRDLDLSGNEINKISFLDKLTSLRNLRLHDNHIEKIDGLNKLKKLKHLDFSKNNIEKIEGLDELENLEVLDLKNNDISPRIGGLSRLKKLKRLHLDSNNIMYMQGIDKLQKLEKITLSSNDIMVIRGLWKQENLKHLDLSNNELDFIWGIENLSGLEEFIFAGNKLDAIPDDVKELKNLRKLDLRNNFISRMDDEDINMLTGMNYLEHVMLDNWKLGTGDLKEGCKKLKKLRPDIKVVCRDI